MNSTGKQLPRNAVPDGQRLPEPLLVRGDGPAEDAGPVRVALEGDHLVPHDLRRIFHWQVDERLAVLELDDVRERRPVGDLAEADPAGAAAAGQPPRRRRVGRRRVHGAHGRGALEDALVEDEGRRVVAREVLRDALEPPAAVEAHHADRRPAGREEAARQDVVRAHEARVRAPPLDLERDVADRPRLGALRRGDAVRVQEKRVAPRPPAAAHHQWEVVAHGARRVDPRQRLAVAPLAHGLAEGVDARDAQRPHLGAGLEHAEHVVVRPAVADGVREREDEREDALLLGLGDGQLADGRLVVEQVAPLLDDDAVRLVQGPRDGGVAAARRRHDVAVVEERRDVVLRRLLREAQRDARALGAEERADLLLLYEPPREPGVLRHYLKKLRPQRHAQRELRHGAAVEGHGRDARLVQEAAGLVREQAQLQVAQLRRADLRVVLHEVVDRLDHGGGAAAAASPQAALYALPRPPPPGLGWEPDRAAWSHPASRVLPASAGVLRTHGTAYPRRDARTPLAAARPPGVDELVFC
ncbi:unnamed protein product, partial [Pelagomonas calceolata]